MSMKERVDSILDGLKEELFKLSLDIHDNPELGLVEYKACAWQKELLEKYGFSFEMPYCGLDTAFKASYYGKKPGPKIAYLSEYDALEGIGHACGHNLESLTACGPGIALREFVDEFGGSVHVFGTPAEETVGGKCIMADHGAFDDMDITLRSHPGAGSRTRRTTAALNGYRFEFFGKPAHSAGNPDKGINALDAAINTFNMINALRQHTQDSARIHGIIEKGGDAANIVPKYASVLMEVRSPDKQYHAELCEKVLNCARAAAMGAGARLEISHYEEFFDVLLTNMALADVYDEQLREYGFETTGNIEHGFGSADAGNVSQRCPNISPSFDVAHGIECPWHSVEAAELCGSIGALEDALISAKVLTLTGVKLLEKPELVEKVREEFREATKQA